MSKNPNLHGRARVYENSIEVTLNNSADSYYLTLFICTELAKLRLISEKVQEQRSATTADGHNYYTWKIYCTQKGGRIDLGLKKFLEPIKKMIVGTNFVIATTKVSHHTLTRSDEVEIYIEKPARKGLLGI